MTLDSPHWHHDVGSCILHGVPQLPCPACLAEHHPDVTAHLDTFDRLEIDDGLVTIRDLLPAEDGDWLLERVAA